MSKKIDIRKLTLEELQSFCEKHNLPKFRAKQVWEWLWGKRATDFEQMSSLSKQMRDLFANYFLLELTFILSQN